MLCLTRKSVACDLKDEIKPLKTAFLTSGKGLMSYGVFRCLSDNTDLKTVVFPEKSTVKSRLERLREFGFTHYFQNSFSWIINLTFFDIKKQNLESRGIKSLVWKSTNHEKIIIELKKSGVDVIFIYGFKHILRKCFLKNFKQVINIHPSLLPYYRGPDPLFWSFIDKSPFYSVSFHIVDQGIDTGDIIDQYSIKRPILPLIICAEYQLSKRLYKFLSGIIQKISQGTLTAIPQAKGFYRSLPTLSARRRIKAQNTE